MSDPSPPIPPSPMQRGGGGGRWISYLLLALALVPYLLVLGDPPLWDSNEPLYAEPPREVLEHGDFLAPTWNGATWFVHAPLSTWITVPFYRAFGVSPFSERLPMALAAMGTVLLTYVLAKAAGGRRLGLMAALVLAGTPRFWLTSRQLAGDVYLASLLMGAFALALPALRTPGAGRKRLFGAYALVGLGMLAKGPVILLLFGVPLGLAAMCSKPRVALKSLRPVLGLFVALAVGLPWFGYMWARFGNTFLTEHFVHQTFERALSDELGTRPFWYYAKALLGDGQPWIFILPLAVVRAVRARDRRPAALLPWVSAAFTVALFSASSGKRNVYLLPMYPMLAIGLAPVLLDCWDGARRRFARWAGAVLTLGAGGPGVLLVVAAHRVPMFAGPELPMTVICFAAAVAALVGCVRASGRTIVVGIVGGALALEAASALLLPTLTRFRPVPRFAAALVAAARPGDVTLVYRPSGHGTTFPSLMYYARRKTAVTGGPAERLADLVPEGHRAFILCAAADEAGLQAVKSLEVREVDRAPYLDVFQFKRLVLGEGEPMKDLVLLVAERTASKAEGSAPAPR